MMRVPGILRSMAGLLDRWGRGAGVRGVLGRGGRRAARRLWRLPARAHAHAKETAGATFLAIAPRMTRVILALNRIIPSSGRLRRSFEVLVFQRHWDRWYKSAYIPNHRDCFFE